MDFEVRVVARGNPEAGVSAADVLDPPVVDRPRAQVLTEQLAGAAVRAPGARPGAGDGRGELRVYPHLQRVRQQLGDLLAQPGPRAALLRRPG